MELEDNGVHFLDGLHLSIHSNNLSKKKSGMNTVSFYSKSFTM